MAYKWKPSKSARRAFAQKMQNDSNYAAEYYARKEAKAEKRRNSSQFDYSSAGGNYVPTKEHHDFCLFDWPENATPEQEAARNTVLYGFSCQEKVHHDNIHIINEMRRAKLS